jgi:putative redox protein
MLLVALAACSSVDVVEIMAKKRQPLTGLEVVITGEHAPDPPWAYQTIQILYKLRGRGLTEKAVAQAVQLSTDKYCSVAATVRGVARITTAYEWVDESV